MVSKPKISRAPSPYPRLMFHLIRLAQFISAGIVTAILSFFVHYLYMDGYYIPWTFWVLLGVSCFTNLSVFVTAFFYHFRTLRPGLSSVINTFLTALWILGFGMLTWSIRPLLADKCDLDHWEGKVGIMVCRLYKALEAFTVLGLVFTSYSLVMDIVVLRKSQARGKYNVMRTGAEKSHPHHSADDDFSARLVPGDTAAYGDREGSFDAGHHGHEDVRRPYKAQQPMDAGRFGYQAPIEQTSYQGGGGRVMDQAFAREGA